MNLSHLRRLLSGGETRTVEFKTHVNDSGLVEAVVCLANGSGGHLLIGVDDSGRVVGARPRHGDHTDASRIEGLVLGRTQPPVQVAAEIVSTDRGEVLAIEVQTAAAVVATSSGKYVRRAIDSKGKPYCAPMRPHEVVARANEIGVLDYSKVTLRNVSFEDLSAVEFARYRDLAASGGDRDLAALSDSELLKALELLGPMGELTVGALLLFGKEEAISRKLPTHEIAFQELDDRLKVRTNDMSRTPLLRAMVELSDRIKARNPETEIEIGLQRIGLPRYADAAVRELIANALVHRDYTAMGTVVIRTSEAGLRVSNPGGFPEGITLSNMLTAGPKARNPALADAFKRAGRVERTGRGIIRAFESQLELGRPAPDYSRTNTHSVMVQVWPGPADEELAAYVTEARQSGRGFSLRDLLVLHEVRIERQITVSRAAELFQVGEQEARAVLNRLADRGLLEARGRTKARTYYLASALYGRFGEPEQYIRARGFDHLQQEQMVLAFVEQYSSIARREAAELCKITSEQAGRLLRRLRDEGKLELVGQKRGSRYVKTAPPPSVMVW